MFDHTSLIRFLETRFGKGKPDLTESNITPWRRAVCGDLTSAFNFENPDHSHVNLPNTHGYAPPDRDRHADYVPIPPGHQSMPGQERGVRYARALPYALQASGSADFAGGSFTIGFNNLGAAGACFHVRPKDDTGPWTFTVESQKSLSHSFGAANHAYDLDVHGPNGFFRSFKGGLSSGNANVEIVCDYDRGARLRLTLTNNGRAPAQFTITNLYGGSRSQTVLAGHPATMLWDCSESHGWYDLTVKVHADNAFERRLAGHIETGADSISDPQLGS
jgi:phospholipase C